MTTHIIHHKTNHSKHKKKRSKWSILFIFFRNIFLFCFALFFILSAVMLIFISNITLPDFSNFENRKIDNSTQIFDRTGKNLLYNVHSNIKRTQISGDRISKYVKDATVATEDRDFYTHYGIKPTSIIRATVANLRAGKFVQGGSTITQQVIKNALLTQDKSIIRKITEWAMAIKLDAQVSKDDILTIYLNEAPYGGNIYGIETAAQYFFGKSAQDLSLVEAAYLTALPNAPSYYSPYGNNVPALEERKNFILKNMFEQNFITKEEYEKAKNEKVVWQKNSGSGNGLHFVFFVRDYLEKRYGKDVVDNGGLKVITTLDYDWQKKAEEIVKTFALENDKKYNATNAGLVAIDPKTGQILTMVGSRDYFDTKIPGKYNIATALRQPGSSIKPFVYAAAFIKGYNPNTVLFDLDTEFNTACDANHNPLPQYLNARCYNPSNYDGIFRGPISLRNALAQSLNIPAVKVLYLTGIQNSVSLAKDFGLNSLDVNGDYGLSFVLGSGEVSLLELTNAYSVFANNGAYNKPSFILSVKDKDDNVLENYTNNPKQVLPEDVAITINDVLSDYNAKIPSYGLNSPLHFLDRPVASKTGTTNDFRDTWTLGYTPNVAVGVWAGNNDNTSINKKLSGLVAAPMWRAFMNVAIASSSTQYFTPASTSTTINNPVINGVYCDGDNFNTILSKIKSKDDLSEAENNFLDPMAVLWQASIDTWVSKGNICPFNTKIETN